MPKHTARKKTSMTEEEKKKARAKAKKSKEKVGKMGVLGEMKRRAKKK